jgi:diketogulonate reductase-like aldo/keto reductase
MLDGQEIPQFGLGVYEMSDQETYDCVKRALEVGYRHIDTAEWYENEEPCGRAIRDFMSAYETRRDGTRPTQSLLL